MLSILEYAAIAGHVYNSAAASYMGTSFTHSTRKDVRQNADDWHIMHDVDPYVIDGGNFFAALYIKFDDGEATDAVIAIRGTDPQKPDNLLTDVVSWYSSAMGTNWHDSIPRYFANAADFSERVFDYLKYFPTIDAANLRLTGHSLGGALAQLMSVRCFCLPCVVFNSPSCRGLEGASAGNTWPLITNVNSRYGIINKVGGNPVGKLNVVDVTEMETEANAMFEHFNRTEFKTGEKVEQFAEKTLQGIEPAKNIVDMVGAELHLGAMLSSGSELDKLPNEHMKIVECEGVQHYQGLTDVIYTLSKDETCDMAVTFSTMAQTILAQHQIGNVIKALYHTPKVAGQVI